MAFPNTQDTFNATPNWSKFSDNFGADQHLPVDPTEYNPDPTTPKGSDWGGFANTFGTVAKGASGLIGSYLAWQNMKDLKTAREQDMAFQREQYNYAKQNNERAIAEHAQSRAIQYS